MSNSVDEQLIQRCVDNELTSEERRRLIGQLEASPESWKTLACTYMEEQLFAAAVVDSDRQAASKLAPRSAATQSGTRHWLHHPLTSVALTACVAFLLGMLISGEFKANGVAAESVAGIAAIENVDASDSVSNNAQPTAVGTLASDGPGYRVQFESDGDTLKELSVFDDQALYFSEYVLRQQPLWKALARELELSGGNDPTVKFIRLRTEDGRLIVVPVEYFSVAPRFQ